MKDYCLFRYYSSGNVVLVGCFSRKEAAMDYKRRLEEKNPMAEYQIHER